MEALSPSHGPKLRICGLVAGLGAGKTWIGAEMAIRMAHENAAVYATRRHPAVVVGVPDYGQAEGASFAAVCDRLTEMGREFTTRTSGKYFDVRFDGTCIAWVSAERPKKIEGWATAALWVDEPDSIKAAASPGYRTVEVWLARVRSKKAAYRRAWFTGTPLGFGTLYDLYHGTDERKPNPALVPLIRSRTRDNPFLPDDYESNQRESMTKRLAAALLDGEFVDLTEGQAYEEFNREKHVKADLTYDPASPVLLAFDFNRNPLHAIMLQQRNGKVLALREWVIAETTTSAVATCIADELTELKHKAGVIIYGDPSGQRGSTQSRHSDYDLIREQLATGVFGSYTQNVRRAPTAVLERVACVNRVLRREDLVISPRCKALIHDLVRVTFKNGTTELEKNRDKKLTHASDALGYCLQQITAGPSVSSFAY